MGFDFWPSLSNVYRFPILCYRYWSFAFSDMSDNAFERKLGFTEIYVTQVVSEYCFWNSSYKA